MSPMYWLILYIYFMSIFFLMFFYLYYNYKKIMKYMTFKKKNTKSWEWKW